MRLITTILALAALLSSTARADLINEPYAGVRPLALGNAFIAMADDDNTPWYNPAGLVNIRGAHLTLLDFTLGTNSWGTLHNAYDAGYHQNFNSLLSTSNPQYLRANFKMTYIQKYFSFTVYDGVQTFSQFQNLTTVGPSSSVMINSANDLGAMAALAVPFGDYISFGVSMRFIQRSSINADLSPQILINAMEAEQSVNPLTTAENLVEQGIGLGWGISAIAGLMGTVPFSSTGKLVLAATAENIGETTFRSIGGSNVPPAIRPSYNTGLNLNYKLGRFSEASFLADWRDMTSSQPLWSQLHAGGEYKLGPLAFRMGLYQGHVSGGIGINAPPHTRINFTTYEVEMGNFIDAAPQRWYLLELAIGFNPI